MSSPAINYHGPDWSVFEEYLGEMLLETYQRLAATDCTESETEQLRGRAQFIGLLLDLKREQPQSDLTL